MFFERCYHVLLISTLLLSFQIHTLVPALYADFGSPNDRLRALDSSGSSRDSAVFNTSEKMALSYSMANSNFQFGAGTISFKMTITDPTGVEVFKQEGSGANPDQFGSANTSVSAMSILNFFTIPGTYIIKGEATFSNGAQTFFMTMPVQIFSPLLNLAYPPDNSREITDQPLIFRWFGVGANKYKVTVSEYPSLFNPILTSESTTPQFTYPTNPSDVRQRLASGQVYYWSVEGMDSSGTKILTPPYPFSFSLGGSVVQSQSRDVALAGIDLSPIPTVPGKMALEVTVKNQGGRAEANLPVSLFVQGAPQGRMTLDSLNSSEERKLTFEITLPSQRFGLGFHASAILEGFFDDNQLNNGFTQMIPWPKVEEEKTQMVVTPPSLGPIPNFPSLKPRLKEILEKALSPEVFRQLEGYEFMNGDVTDQELDSILFGISNGTTKILEAKIE